MILKEFYKKNGFLSLKLSSEEIHEPWLSRKTINYPSPIIDHEKAMKEARQKIWEIHKGKDAQREKKRNNEKAWKPKKQ